MIAFDATSDFYKSQSGSYEDAKKYDQKKDFASKKASFEAGQRAKQVRKAADTRRRAMNKQSQPSTVFSPQVKKPKVKAPKGKRFGAGAMKYLKKNRLGLGIAGLAGLGTMAALN